MTWKIFFILIYHQSTRGEIIASRETHHISLITRIFKHWCSYKKSVITLAAKGLVMMILPSHDTHFANCIMQKSKNSNKRWSTDCSDFLIICNVRFKLPVCNDVVRIWRVEWHKNVSKVRNSVSWHMYKHSFASHLECTPSIHIVWPFTVTALPSTRANAASANGPRVNPT